VQHRIDHRARHGARGARPADRGQRLPRDQAGAELSRRGRSGCSDTQATGGAALCRQPLAESLRPTAGWCARFAGAVEAGAAESENGGESADGGRYERSSPACSTSRAAGRWNTIVLACTHFPLVQAEWRRRRAPAAFVDGKEGIRVESAFLTAVVTWADRPRQRDCGVHRAGHRPGAAAPCPRPLRPHPHRVL
jgi:glutamate racemase